MGEPLASFHLTRERATRLPLVLAHLGLDRGPLARTPGLRFVRLMGTGRGRTTSLSADLTRTAMFAVWHDADALERFLATSPIQSRWRAADEHYVARLRLIRGGGRWAGTEPLAAMPLVESAPTSPVAVLTRADVHRRAWRPFVKAGRPVSEALGRADGVLAAVGIGEAPLGRQATFSLWRDAAALEAFAYGDPAHTDVIRRTRAEGWYGDELFARFAPTTVEGAWDGVDPLGVDSVTPPAPPGDR